MKTLSGKLGVEIPIILKYITHPAASLYPLVDIVREGLTGHVASGSLCGVEVSILQYDLSLTDDHQGCPTHLGTLENVVLNCLENKKQQQDTAC